MYQRTFPEIQRIVLERELRLNKVQLEQDLLSNRPVQQLRLAIDWLERELKELNNVTDNISS